MPLPVCFTMDNLGDAADLHRGVIAAPRQPGHRPALEQGFPALLELFRRYEIPITHFVEGWSAEAYPYALERVLAAGYSIGMHGWQHERWAELSDDEMQSLGERATDSIRRHAGVTPTIFRAPGGARPATATPILNALGYTLDASLAPNGQDGGPITQLSDTLWSIPYNWQGVDATHWLWQQNSDAVVAERWLQWLADCLATDTPAIFIWHPHVMGIDQGRLAIGEQILQFIRSSDDFLPVSLPQLQQWAVSRQ